MRSLTISVAMLVLAGCRAVDPFANEDPRDRTAARVIVTTLTQQQPVLDQAIWAERNAWKLLHEQVDEALAISRGEIEGFGVSSITEGRAADFGRARELYRDVLTVVEQLPVLLPVEYAQLVPYDLEGPIDERLGLVREMAAELRLATKEPSLLEGIRQRQIELFPNVYPKDGTSTNIAIGWGEVFVSAAMIRTFSDIRDGLQRRYALREEDLK